MKEFVKLGLKLNTKIWHWYKNTPNWRKRCSSERRILYFFGEGMWYISRLRHEKSDRGLDTKVGKESYLYPACGGHSPHNKTNDNGKRMVNFARVRGLAVTVRWYQNKNILKVTWQQNI